jgi:hypothetical protein
VHPHQVCVFWGGGVPWGGQLNLNADSCVHLLSQPRQACDPLILRQVPGERIMPEVISNTVSSLQLPAHADTLSQR